MIGTINGASVPSAVGEVNDLSCGDGIKRYESNRIAVAIEGGESDITDL